MHHFGWRFLFCFSLLWAGILAGGGCSSESPSVRNRYVPPLEVARTALEAVLIDWSEGRELGSITRLEIPIHVADNQRKPGQTLEEFEILGEAPGDAGRCLAVRVKLKNPDAVEKVRFVVLGINPLWVFRQEDFESLSQWSCGKPDEPAATSANPSETDTVAVGDSPAESVADVEDPHPSSLPELPESGTADEPESSDSPQSEDAGKTE